MVAFAFQTPDPSPALAPGGSLRASVIVQPNPGNLSGYRWHSRREMEDPAEATRAAIAQLKLIELQQTPGGCPGELARHLAHIHANDWD